MESKAFIWGFSDKFRVFEGKDQLNDKYLDAEELALFDKEWVIPSLKNANEKKLKKVLGDFPSTTGFSHLVSQRALDLLGDVFEKNGVLLPVNILDSDVEGTYYLFKCKNIKPCLLIEQSFIKYSPLNKDRISSVLTPVFDENLIGRLELFILPENIGGHIYISSDLFSEIKRLGLEGFVASEAMFSGKCWVS